MPMERDSTVVIGKNKALLGRENNANKKQLYYEMLRYMQILMHTFSKPTVI